MIILFLYNEDNILRKCTNLTYGPIEGKNYISNIIICTYTKARCLGDLKIVCINMTNRLDFNEIFKKTLSIKIR